MTTIAFDARKLGDFGIGTYVHGLIGALAPLLAPREELVLLGDREAARRADAPLPALRWVEERSPLYSLRELRGVARAAARAGADLLHVPHYTMPVGSPCPAVVTIHDLIHLRFPGRRSPLHRLYARWMIGRAVRGAAVVIAVSQATKRELAERFGAAAERVEVVPNGIDERFFEPVPRAELDRKLAAWRLEPGYLLFVGNPMPHKNLEALVEATALLRARDGGGPTLVLAGARGAGAERVGDLSSRAGLADRCRVLPHLPASDLPALYAGAGILAIPSLWEGFGLPAAEAMACGVPVVAADRGGLPEVVGDAGELVDPASAPKLAGRIAALLDHPARRAELSRRGRERAQRFRWPEAARRTLELYRAALARRGATA